MKNWLYYLATAFALYAITVPVKAQMPDDLQGAELQQQGVCMYEGSMFQCAVYQKDGKNYVLYAAGNRVVLIFSIKDGATMPYTNDDMTLVWQRGKAGKEV